MPLWLKLENNIWKDVLIKHTPETVYQARNHRNRKISRLNYIFTTALMNPPLWPASPYFLTLSSTLQRLPQSYNQRQNLLRISVPSLKMTVFAFSPLLCFHFLVGEKARETFHQRTEQLKLPSPHGSLDLRRKVWGNFTKLLYRINRVLFNSPARTNTF